MTASNKKSTHVPSGAASASGITLELFEQLLTKQLEEGMRFLPNTISKVLELDGTFLCGGSLTSLANNDYFNDYDIFFTSSKSLDVAVKRYSNGLGPVMYSTNAITIGKMQLIKKSIHHDIQGTFSEFDFTVVQIAFDGEKIYYGDDTVEDLYNKYLRINSVSCPYKSLKRLIKFAKRGYNVVDAYPKLIRQLELISPYEIATNENIYF